MHEDLAPPPIVTLPTFAAYTRELAAWLSGSAGDDIGLYQTTAKLGSEVRASGHHAEHMLMRVHALGLNPDGWSDVRSEEREFRDRRYLHAITLLMQECFASEPALRSVRGSDGREWIVLWIRENLRWDPRIDIPRKDWLSCVARDDRRYITPVPLGWEQWSDSELLTNILRAKPDARGPS